MSEVLAQLEKKGGGGEWELFVTNTPSILTNNVPQTITLTSAAPKIKQIILALFFTNNALIDVYTFDVDNTNITNTSSIFSSYYGSYLWLTLNGDQLTIRETISSSPINNKIYIYSE